MNLQLILVAVLATLASSAHAAETAEAPSPWRIIIANDTCPDVTWGFTEEQTRQALADLVRAHLDEMTRTDTDAPENRDHYNMTATFEALCFMERYPERKQELIRRVREGRICVSPFLCNSLWGLQSVEGVLRTFYPARRLEREWGIPLDVAEHIELPSLPWGMASILAGCSVRWTSVPFLDYDCTFKGLKSPPLFRLEGPDGSEVRVVLDAWASLKANYAQGAHLLKDGKRVTDEWIPHYKHLGATYPLRTVLASGTHSDISPNSGKQARGFADGIRQYNAAATNSARLLNGTLAQFCRAVDAAEAQSPFLPKLRGCFGHSWELWPVSLAHTVAAWRENERLYLTAESMVALASQARPGLADQTRADREQAEWFWAMLADHAWNGTDLKNKRHNAELRRRWAEGLARLGQKITRQAWRELGLKPDGNAITVFNPLSFANDVLTVCDAPAEAQAVTLNGKAVAAQTLRDEGKERVALVAAKVPAFGFRGFRFERKAKAPATSPLRATAIELEGPYYRLQVDVGTGGLRSLIHKPSGQELLVTSSGRTLGQTVFFAGQEQVLTGVVSEVVANGPTLARLRVTGSIGDIRVTNLVTLFTTLDRVDFDLRLHKPATTNEQRLLHFFPVAEGAKDLRIETTAAVLRPRLQPDGDLMPGADTRRFAVQGFVDHSPADRVGVTIAALDAFMLRLDQGALAFEALGNDQNWKEVLQDQDGIIHFRFRYSLRAHAPGYDNAASLAWSRSVSAPAVAASGRLPSKWLDRPHLEVDPNRALATCLKPADGVAANHVVVRVWETSGAGGPLALTVPGYRKATETDLLERERGKLPVKSGKLSVNVRGHGFSAVKLER